MAQTSNAKKDLPKVDPFMYSKALKKGSTARPSNLDGYRGELINTANIPLPNVFSSGLPTESTTTTTSTSSVDTLAKVAAGVAIASAGVGLIGSIFDIIGTKAKKVQTDNTISDTAKLEKALEDEDTSKITGNAQSAISDAKSKLNGKSKSKDLTKASDNVIKAKNQVTAKKNGITRKITEATTKKQRLTNEKSTISKEIDTNKKAMEKLDGEIKENTNKISDLGKSIQDKKTKLSQITDKSSTEYKELDAEIKRDEKALETLENAQKVKNEEHKRLSDEVAEKTERYGKIDDEINALPDINALKQEESELSAQEKEADKVISQIDCKLNGSM